MFVGAGFPYNSPMRGTLRTLISHNCHRAVRAPLCLTSLSLGPGPGKEHIININPHTINAEQS